MTFAPGNRLGKFEIVAPLGVGAMGEVYRARDTALGRDVAIKVLPDSLALDPERVGRFEREARVLASLNHPNIAAIHDGLMKDDATHFLVMELVEGETLAERLERGALPLREILLLFRQVASALEAAHGRGIVHRDLKPENVKITPEGNLKVLDFGLAKELYDEVPRGDGSKTKTAPTRWTRQGDVLGTPAYMSPEQARGQSLDKRTDIWSFGCCLFEALAGRHPFHGKTVSDVLAAVISAEPDFGALPVSVPGNVVHLLRRCLQKDVNRRLHDIGDARAEIEEALEHPETSAPRAGVSLSRAGLGAGAALVLGLALGAFFGGERPVDTRLVRRFTIELPPTEPLAVGAGPALAISGDGTRMVYSVRRGASTELRLRAMDRLEPTRLPGTDGAQGPFFAPTGDSVGFFSHGRLQRLSLGDLSVQPMESSPSPRGASWGLVGILFSPRTTSGLSLVSTAKPGPVVVTELHEETGERSHRWPALLPDGEHALFTTWKGDRFDVEVVSLETRERRLLVEDGSHARYAPSGHLIFARGTELMAATFDVSRLEVGTPVPAVEGVLVDALTGAALYDFSAEGTLVYASAHEGTSGEALGQLLRVDRFGNASMLNPVPRGYQVPRLSPDDEKLAVTLTEGDSTDIWLSDVARGSMSRVTFDANNGAAIWSPDGKHVTFSSDRDGAFNLFVKAVDSSSLERRLTSSPNAQFPCSWSPDGQKLVYTEIDPENQFDVWVWSAATGKSEPLIRTPFNESAAVVSPDGRLLAYVSDESGQDEVYVRAFPGAGGKWTISTGGGREPVWRDDGAELFYRNGDWMFSVSIGTQPDFSAGSSRPLFEAPYDEAGTPYASYDVSRDGEEFIMVRSGEERDVSRLIVVLDWFAELEARLPRPR